ncbi:protein phosphatase 2C domain-containing protein [Promicromonospora iranensis]|uniref:Serine/threonine protein phosphatase PrpC n=1 Tax=Promicromonospora iranensis TaxID=1105144 RepID=A0ABU2CQI4_9MICO|nr:protein phosphatase 2C domain-containing protein [Promicromonospora iranensis]MDR7383607.1 serine/threonine protein phosphatase PrpC [Promicromonospora iranensis]
MSEEADRTSIRAASLAGGPNNQDRYVVGDGFAAVLDGATSVAGDRSHDPGWYAERLGQALSETVPRGEPLADAVAGAIRTVRDAHGLTPDTSPTSTVAIARWSDDVVETYTLGDSYVVVLRAGSVETVYTDDRLDAVGADERAAYRARLAAGHGYDVGHREVLLALQAEQARRRNRPGGYWIAGAEPEAAHHGLTTAESRSGITGLLLASDGVDPQRHPVAATWRELAEHANGHGEAQVLQDVHDAEASDQDGQRWPRAKRHDDKTLVTIRL